MGFPLPIPPPLQQRVKPGMRVLLALSGGVDSATALALLTDLGCRVECVTFKNFCYAETDDPTGRACCSLESIEDARRLAHSHGAAHWVSDMSAKFSATVIEPFVAAYIAGATPNPCQTCNAAVRFPELVRLADRQGCELVATGHYARIGVPSRPYGGDGTKALAAADAALTDAVLLRGVDADKDQAYFLYRVARRLLPRLVFPVGWYTKHQIRSAATDLGLPVARKLESQEICFVPDGDRSFLFPEGGSSTEPGEIVDRSGIVLGRHRGLVHYTVGQRRGLGIAAPQPLYVLTLDVARNRLVVGLRDELAATEIVCGDFHAGVPDFPAVGPATDFAPSVTARIRHRHVGVPVASWRRDGKKLAVQLAASVDGVAPGQGLVLYAGDVVLGGGRIVASEQEL